MRLKVDRHSDLDRHKPPVDFDGNFHRSFLRSDF